MADSHSLTFSNAKTYVKTYSYNSGTSYSVDSTQSFGCKFTKGATSAADVRVEKILYIPPSGVYSIFLENTTVFSEDSTVSGSISAISGNTDTEYYSIRAPVSAVSGSAEQIFNQLDSGGDTLVSTLRPNSSGIISFDKTVTDSETVKNALRYGVFIRSINYPTADYQAYYSLKSITLDLLYYTPDSPADVRVLKPSQSSPDYYSAHVAATDTYTTEWKFIQPTGVPQSGFSLTYSYIPVSSYTPEVMLDVITSAATSYTIRPEDWIMPKGTDGWTPYHHRIKVWVRVYTKNNSVVSKISEDNTGDDFSFYEIYFPHPYDLSPGGNSNILSADVTRLSWKIKFDCEEENFSVSNDPTNFDIEYSRNGGESWDKLLDNGMVSRDGDLYYYDVPANTFPAGIIRWRVRAYAGGKTIDTYESEAISSRVQASTSSVTCDGKPLPTISWTSSAQVAYQVRFADYDSGARYGTATSFTVPYFYADGYYPVQVRTQASDGTWSAWTELEYVQITNTAPSNTVTMTAVPTRHAVVLNWTDSGTAETYIVYRNHIPVYIGTDTTYTDIAANGECTYYVRAIQSKDYSQSGSVTVNAYPKTDCLYDFASMQWIPLKYSLQERSRNYSSSADVIFKNYAGRTKPVTFSSGHTVRQMSGAYVFKTREEALRLRNTVGKTVIFKDTRGGTIIGILNNPDITVQRKLYAVTFLVTETDYIEEREYASE